MKHLSALLVALLIISCGKNPQSRIVDHLYVTTERVNEDVWISLTSELNLGGMQMTSLTLPIHDPKNPGTYFGELSFGSDFTTMKSIVDIKVNFSKLSQVEGSFDPTLPTGEPLPFRGLEGEEIIEFEIPQIKSKVYIYVSKESVLIGFASTIKEFSEAAPYLGGADLFFGFNKNNIRGSVGFFSKVETKETGLGLFADLSQVVSADVLRDLVLSQNVNKAFLSTTKSSKSVQRKVIKSYLKISSQGDQLHQEVK